MSTTARPPSDQQVEPEQPPRREPTGSLWRRFIDGDLRFSPASPERRMRALTIGLLLMLSVFTVRLVWVQIVDSGAMAARAEEGRLDTKTLKAPRGSILDVRGAPMVQSVEARNIVVDQTLIADPAGAAKKVAPLVKLPEEKVREALTGDRRYAVVAKEITPVAAQEVLDLEIAGLSMEKTSRRDYPGGTLGANVLGFVGTDGYGLAGLELEFDDVLAGSDGSRSVEVAGGKLIPTGTDEEKAAVPGKSIRLTLDRDLQFVAQSALERQVAASQAQSGTAIVMEAETGRILAMASVPTLDANHPERASTANTQNRAVVEAFEPGSTTKLITMAAAINEGKADPSSVFTVPATIKRGTRQFSDHDKEHETYDLTLAGILTKSSNTGSIQVAERVGEEKFLEYLKRFGVGQPSGLGFPGESNGYVPPLSDWTDSTFPTLAFGQGMSLTAVQVASVFQTISNDGVRVDPRLVESVIDDRGEEVAVPPPTSRKVVEPTTAHQVLRMMEGVTTSEEGTAGNVNVPGYVVGGKTGTANRVDDSCGCYKGYTSSFIGVAPAKDPKVVTAVIIQDPKGAYMGSSNGVPVFNEVMAAALQTVGAPPDPVKDEPLPVFATSNPDKAATMRAAEGR